MSPRFLLVDSGNTRLKARKIQSEGTFQDWSFSGDDGEKEAFEVLSRQTVEGVLISSTKGDEEKLKNWFPGSRVFLLKPDLFPAIQWAYPHPENMGKDRLAALAGAHELYPGRNLMIADAGSCLTLDFLDRNGVHLGGVISPGLKMRFQAMHAFTGKLPLVSESSLRSTAGTSTEECMASGSVFGLVAEMEFHLKQISESTGLAFELILTGGDANYLAHRIKPANFVHPDLVFIGMQAVLARLL